MPSYRYTFISHAHADNALCDPFAAAFARLGVPHYYDRANPQIGHDIGEALERELKEAQALVVLASPQSLASPWVREEINIFFALTMREPTRLLIPVKVAPCDLPPRLEARWWVDAVARPAHEVVAEVARALDQSSGAAPAAPIPPVQQAPAMPSHHLPAEGPLAQEAHTAFTNEHWGDVLDKTEILIERGAMTPSLWRERASAAFALNDAAATEVAVDQAFKAESDHPDTLLLRARLFAKAGDDAQAVTTFTRAYALAPLDATATRLLILDDLTAALARLGRWDEFTRRVADARRMAPEDSRWLLRPVETLLRAQRFDEAISAAQSLPAGVNMAPLLPTWKNAIAEAVRAENWPTRRALLDAALAAGADPATVAHWRRLDFPRFDLLATLSGHTDCVHSVAWAPDGARLATASHDKTARVWEAASGRLLATLSGHTNEVFSVAWAPDGARLATASVDKTARVWGEE